MLRNRRLAIDASIWIYQFIRSMRDKEGYPIRNAHLLGFFRRICKLLFYNIKPVFVFDGGVPVLKLSTIKDRRERREGVRKNLKSTAEKILRAQMKTRLLQQKGKLNENAPNLDDLALQAVRSKPKLDQFELPHMDRLNTNAFDPRLATTQELKDFVDDFLPEHMDIDSEAFSHLPPEIQYEIIQDIKVKSRQTSWARLESMVRGSKTALDFSKFQIKNLKHRNEVMQRLLKMNTVAAGDTEVEAVRVASERGKEYVLYKNEDISEGLGWKLPGLTAERPLELDSEPKKKIAEPPMEKLKEKKDKPIGKDKVMEAVASNPRLAAMFQDFMSDDDDEEEEEEEYDDVDLQDVSIPGSIKENSALSSKWDKEEEQESFIEDIGGYIDNDSDAMDRVIAQMYQDDISKQEEEKIPLFMDTQQRKPKTDPAFELDPDDFLQLWRSRAPDAFIYLYSLNNEYEKITYDAIYELSIPELEKSLQSIRKKHGKKSSADELGLEATEFHQKFLENVIEWKRMRVVCDYIDEDSSEHAAASTLVAMMAQRPVENQSVSSSSGNPFTLGFKEPEALETESKDSYMVFHDSDSDQEEINFVQQDETIRTKEMDTKKENQSFIQPSLSSVKINIQQSVLNKNKMDCSVTAQAERVVKPTDTLEQPSDRVGDIETSEKEKIDEEVNKILEEESISYQDIIKQNSDNSAEPIVIQEHGYNSEEEMEDTIQEEESEYVRFVSDLASKDLYDVQKELDNELKDLNAQKRKQKASTVEVTSEMVQEIQELLKIFGVPYIVSPMEAEAQCAKLEELALVEGVITDDSDVFLFGSTRVYKNMFNQQKYVECYVKHDIEREMELDRKKLIQIAFLLGSDYTEGIPGIGPVAAMEILAEFSENEKTEALEAPLLKFKEWYESMRDNSAFQKKFRKNHVGLEFPEGFPDSRVKDAYYNPLVDTSEEEIKWGQPQLDSLRDFLMEAFGWSESKADEVLLPVIKEMNRKAAEGVQSTINSFFNLTNTVSSTTSSGAQHKHASKRVQSIVDKWKTQKKHKKD
ncbi:PIN domain-like protein [Backusella circina FSU 941]|nr:PIN domain-like protein [Backusella circina FSU 941]